MMMVVKRIYILYPRIILTWLFSLGCGTSKLNGREGRRSQGIQLKGAEADTKPGNRQQQRMQKSQGPLLAHLHLQVLDVK